MKKIIMLGIGALALYFFLNKNNTTSPSIGSLGSTPYPMDGYYSDFSSDISPQYLQPPQENLGQILELYRSFLPQNNDEFVIKKSLASFEQFNRQYGAEYIKIDNPSQGVYWVYSNPNLSKDASDTIYTNVIEPQVFESKKQGAITYAFANIPESKFYNPSLPSNTIITSYIEKGRYEQIVEEAKRKTEEAFKTPSSTTTKKETSQQLYTPAQQLYTPAPKTETKKTSTVSIPLLISTRRW
ncbi:MAG: hypothetical protein QW474_02260 [Candidatus Aenigmatarchaeota archaeon]